MQTNRSKNPKTTAQTLQRVLVKAVGMFYASFTGLNVEAVNSNPANNAYYNKKTFCTSVRH